MRLIAVIVAASVAVSPSPPEPAPPAAVGEGRTGSDGVVWLKAVRFDPLRDERTEVPVGGQDALRPTAGLPAPWIVQFDTPVTAETRASLVEAGVEIIGYVPVHALAVRLPGGVGSASIKILPHVRWVGVLSPGLRISPELLEPAQDYHDGDVAIDLDVSLFDGKHAEGLAAAVAGRFEGIEVRFVRAATPARLTLRVLRGQLDAVVSALARDPAVAFVERRLPFEPDNDNVLWVGQGYDRVNGPAEAVSPDPKPYAQSATLWNRGLRGAGQIIGIADTGIEYDMCFFEDPLTPVVLQSVSPPGALTVQSGHRKLVAVNEATNNGFGADDSFRHGTHVAATAAGDSTAHLAGGGSAGHDHGDGMAPEARIVFEDVGPVNSSTCSTSIVVSSVGDLLEQEYGAGARISSNSWGGGSGVYTASAAEVDTKVRERQDLLVLFSAGNDGAGGVNNIASCKNCVTVGMHENYDATYNDPFGILDPENMAASSSRGPAADGRIKPDLVAPGFGVNSARFDVQYFADGGDPACDDPEACFPSFGGCYVTDVSEACNLASLSGTSMATPATAGLAALARQYFTEGFYPSGQAQPGDAFTPSAALLKAVLLNGARNLTGRLYERRANPADHGPLQDAPSAVQGWGGILLDDALYFTGDARGLRVVDVSDAEGVATGDSRSVQVAVTAPEEPLEITLTWNDPAGQPFAGAALVNDLDLEVVAPDGTMFRGNQWTVDDINVPGDKISAANPGGRDAINNVEGILVPGPPTGNYTVTVRGQNVPGDQNTTMQGFALVVSGALGDAAAPPVHSGVSGPPLTAIRLDDEGTTLGLTWDAAGCPAADYNVLYGALGTVGTYVLDGSVCNLGTAGTHTWTAVPATSLWFVVVASDGFTTEGTWGLAGDGSHRASGTVSGLCGSTARDNTGECPAP